MKDRMIMKKICLISLLFILYGCAHTNPHRQSTLSDALYGFENIQDSARTKVWWFHGETETTREGITADTEAFRKAGVGGVVFYDQVHLKSLWHWMPFPMNGGQCSIMQPGKLKNWG